MVVGMILKDLLDELAQFSPACDVHIRLWTDTAQDVPALSVSGEIIEGLVRVYIDGAPHDDRS